MNLIFLLLLLASVFQNPSIIKPDLSKLDSLVTKTNSSQDVLAASTEDPYIIPANDPENDGETYIAPVNLDLANKTTAADVAQDEQIIASQPVLTARTNKPNIVFLLIDDTGAIDDRIWNRLPTIKRLFIDHGARFTNFFGETPLCCPGRAGYLTGQHTFNHKVTTNDAGLLNPNTTMATELHAAGYYTFLSGKYLNKFNATKQKTPGWDNFAGFGGAYYDFWLWVNGRHIYYPNQYSTEVIKNKALTYLRKAPANKPIFAYIAPFAVHEGKSGSHEPTPAAKYVGDPRCKNLPKWNPPNYNEADISDKPAYVRSRPLLASSNGHDLTKECEALLSVEDLTAKVVGELTRQKRLDNTFFVFGADNGMDWGAHRHYGKVWPYTDRVNFFVHWPNGIGKNPFTVSETVQNIDLAPTFCELAGCRMGPYPNGQKNADGKSFLSVLKRQTTNMGRDVILEDFTVSDSGNGKYYALRTTASSPLGLWHYIENASGEKELYDVSNGPCYLWNSKKEGDPCELNNLLSPNVVSTVDTLPIVNSLKSRLVLLKKQRGNSIPTPTPTQASAQ